MPGEKKLLLRCDCDFWRVHLVTSVLYARMKISVKSVVALCSAVLAACSQAPCGLGVQALTFKLSWWEEDATREYAYQHTGGGMAGFP